MKNKKYFNNFKKFALFSDEDLDGLGCGIVLQQRIDRTYKAELIHKSFSRKCDDFVEFVMGKSNEELKDMLLIISDKSPLEKQINYLANEEKQYNLLIVDHHVPKWDYQSLFHCELSNEKCATKVMFDFLFDEPVRDWKQKYVDKLYQLVDIINDWDIWYWKEKNNLASAHANYLFWNKPEFFDYCLTEINRNLNQEFEFPKEWIEEAEKEYQKIQNRAREIKKNSIMQEINGIKTVCGLLEEGDSRSQIGHTLLELTPEAQACLVISYNQISASVRSEGEEGYALQICRYAHPNGGGHPNASGFDISGCRSEIKEIIKILDKK